MPPPGHQHTGVHTHNCGVYFQRKYAYMKRQKKLSMLFCRWNDVSFIFISFVFLLMGRAMHTWSIFDCRQSGETVQFALLGFIGGVTVNSVLLNQSRIAAFRLRVQSRAFISSSKKNKQTKQKPICGQWRIPPNTKFASERSTITKSEWMFQTLVPSFLLCFFSCRITFPVSTRGKRFHTLLSIPTL